MTNDIKTRERASESSARGGSVSFRSSQGRRTMNRTMSVSALGNP